MQQNLNQVKLKSSSSLSWAWPSSVPACFFFYLICSRTNKYCWTKNTFWIWIFLTKNCFGIQDFLKWQLLPDIYFVSLISVTTSSLLLCFYHGYMLFLVNFPSSIKIQNRKCLPQNNMWIWNRITFPIFESGISNQFLAKFWPVFKKRTLF